MKNMSDYIEKYTIKDKGLALEKTNPEKAIRYYENLIGHDYFKDDYYIYRRLALMYEKTKQDDEKTNIIKEFFKSRIFANEYNYLWFKYKLNALKDKGYVEENEINNLTDYFKSNASKKDSYPPIADRIKKQKGEIIIESEEKYDKRQTRYAYELRASELNRQKRYVEYIDLLNHMIDDLGYRRYDYFKKLCVAYRRLNDEENELRIINRYYNGDSTRTKLSDAWFEKRLKSFNPQKEITFHIDDANSNPLYEYDADLSEKENLKRKSILIRHAKTLNINDAILYYKYLSTNTYFSNDWYPYRKLSILYRKTKDYHANLANIRKLLYSKIHLNDYQFLWFSNEIRTLLGKVDVSDNTLRKWIDYYEMHGALNKHELNNFLADKFIIEDDEVTVLNDDDFEKNQKRLFLRKTGLIYESVENYELAVTHYTNIIHDKEFNYFEFYKGLCESLEKINDPQRMKKAINLYYTIPPQDRTLESDEYIEMKSKKANI